MSVPFTSVGVSNQKKATPTIDEIMASKRFDNKTKVSMDKDFDDQLKILIATFKNQGLDGDADPNQVMQMISQFKNVEGMMMLNWRMTEMNDQNKSIEKTLMNKYLQKEVKLETQDFIFNNTPVDIEYSLPEDVTNASFEVYSPQNLKNPIYSAPLKSDDLNGIISWDGKTATDEKAEQGLYLIKVSGLSKTKKDVDDKAIPIHGKTSIFTTIDSVYSDNDVKEAMLTSGKMLIHPKDIRITRKKAMEAYSKSEEASHGAQTDPFSKSAQAEKSTSTEKNGEEDEPILFPSTSAQHEAFAQQSLNQEV